MDNFLSAYPGFDKYGADPNWIFCVMEHKNQLDVLENEERELDVWKILRDEGHPEDVWRQFQKQSNDRRNELNQRLDSSYAAITNFDPSNYQ
jgi:hypothetical protein